MHGQWPKSEYDQEMPQSPTADQPMAPEGRGRARTATATQQQEHNQSNQHPHHPTPKLLAI